MTSIVPVTVDPTADDLLALVGLEPSDLAEPDLLDLDGCREEGRAASTPEPADDAASDREDRDGPERRFDTGF